MRNWPHKTQSKDLKWAFKDMSEIKKNPIKKILVQIYYTEKYIFING